MFFVPVVNQDQIPLMPTTLLRAKRWITTGKATPFYKKRIFCVRLNQKPSDNQKQDIAVGIDPGSKREAYTVKSKDHTYLNILSNTVDWVQKAIEVRRQMRRARRFRNMRHRPARFNNRKSKKLAPSTKARWQLKLRICKFLKQLFPISTFIVEDIKARTTGKKRWDKSFSPLQVGKNWFYEKLGQISPVITKQGYETKALRDKLGLKKLYSKLSDKFECHNIDSWVLANDRVGNHLVPDNTVLLRLFPIRLYRRQLHMLQYIKGMVRRRHGGTRSLGFKRGSFVKHSKYDLCYVGGNRGNRISLHDIETGKRLTQQAKISDVKFLTYSTWRVCSNFSHT